MCGSTCETISPSVRSTSRSTPCVLGCCGPILTSISSVRTSNSTTRGSSSAVTIRVQGSGFGSATTNAVVFQRHLVVLAERVAFPVLGAEDAAEVGVASEIHAREVIDLSLVPVGGAPDVANRRHFWQFAGRVILPPRQHHLQH